MAAGGPYQHFLASGSNSTNSSTIENFFGSYSGLSLLGQDEVITIQIQGTVQEFFIGPSGAGSVGQSTGLKIYPAASTFTLPSMRVGNASLLRVNRILGQAASANNASWNWVVWQPITWPIVW